MKKILSLTFFCFSFFIFSQENIKDSIQNKALETKTGSIYRLNNRLQDSILRNHSLSQTEKQISIRLGLGIQKSFYAELGAALHECTYGCTGYFSKSFYSAIEWVPTNNQDIYALKVGCEYSAFALSIGLETKYQTDFNKKDIVITPKIGLGLYGDINIFYGFNISTHQNPFIETYYHQFSIVFNFNNHFLVY